MLRTLTNEVRSCYEHAESCASSAGAAPNDGLRDSYRRLEGYRLTLTRSYELSLRLNDLTDYQKQLREKQRLELQESNMHRAVEAKMSDVYITRELDRRTPGKVDTLKEKIALQELAAIMADNPEQVLPKFVSLAMEMTHGVSAGISLYEEHPPPGVFRWHHLQGTLARFAGATTPRNFSPCGIVLDLDAPVLTAYSERAYD